MNETTTNRYTARIDNGCRDLLAAAKAAPKPQPTPEITCLIKLAQLTRWWA